MLLLLCLCLKICLEVFHEVVFGDGEVEEGVLQRLLLFCCFCNYIQFKLILIWILSLANKVTKIKWLTQIYFQAIEHVKFLCLQLRKVANLSVVFGVYLVKILIGLQEIEHLTGSLLHKWGSQRQTGWLLANSGLLAATLFGGTELRHQWLLAAHDFEASNLTFLCGLLS